MSAVVQAELTIELPQMPNFVTIQGMRSIDMDESLQRGTDRFTIDVANLHGASLDAFIQAWGMAFRTHAAKRRSMLVKQESPLVK